MASSTKKALTEMYPALRRGIQQVQRDVFGQYPQLNGQTGHQMNKSQLKGVYYNQYYMEPITKFARMATPGFQTEEEERRQFKLVQLRRRGKGPPKKLAGKKKKK